MDNSFKPSRQNPSLHANILSHLLFGWTIPLLWHGASNGLSNSDLVQCMPNDQSTLLGDRLERNWFKEIERAKKHHRPASFRNALLKSFWRSAIWDAIISLIYIVLKSLIPVVLAQLLIQVQQPLSLKDDELNRNYTNMQNSSVIQEKIVSSTDDEETFSVQFFASIHQIWHNNYWLGGILVASTLLGCFLIHHVDLRQRMLGARLRIACCSLIYRKTLRLSSSVAGNTPPGYLINLLSNDVSRLDYGFIFVHWIWIMPLQAVLVCYLIWLRIGLAAVVGVVSLLLKTIPVQTGLSRVSSRLRMKIAERTDTRVSIMNELIQGIQVIKMYAWEKPFEAVVSQSRCREIKLIRYASYLRGFNQSTMVFTERSTLYVTIAAAVLLGNTISADIVFSIASYYNILQLVAAIWYPLAVTFGAEALITLRRIQHFLQQEEIRQIKCEEIKIHQQILPFANIEIALKNINAKWTSSGQNLTLRDINLTIARGKLCAIIGPVGAGKSSIIQLLLGELTHETGFIRANSNYSYAPQEPWLFSGTVRNNILFGEDYDRKRYRQITKCCALKTDFEQLSDGDHTSVGEKGASLSGGQRARISLARAVYKKADVYLLDDPLSAVDAHVGRHLFEEVIGPQSWLAQEKATRILVTHQVQFLQQADWIIVLDNGSISQEGTFQDLVKSKFNFTDLLETTQADKMNSKRKSSICSTFSDTEYYCGNSVTDYVSDAMDSSSFIGEIGVQRYTSLRRSSTSKTFISSTSEGCNRSTDARESFLRDSGEEESSKGLLSFYVWRQYFIAGSGILGLTFMVLVMILSQVVCSGSDYFVNIWSQQEYLRSIHKPTIFTTEQCLYIYGALILFVILMTVYRGFLFFRICMHASKRLHDRMFNAVLRATIRFFDLNPSGRILNRFSRDMGVIDELLPKAMMEFIQIALVMFGILIVICIVNPILLSAIVVIALIDLCILKIYMQPSQDLKRLESICRSPIFSHVTASLSGLSVIRSCHRSALLTKEFDQLQDVHSAVWQLTMAANTALGLWLDCVSCCFLTIVIFSFFLLDKEIYSGNMGLAISQAMILTGMVQYGVRQVAESLQQMTSVERILQYIQLQQERSDQTEPPIVWPTHGQIEFCKVTCRYDPMGSPVLNTLNFVIQPGWNVGIVGRTGAGKSSLIGALFRLIYVEGIIRIDGIDTSNISLSTLRSKISIIPQDPVLFSATIRYNLDPFDKYKDDELWNALEYVNLKHIIDHLDFMVTERGSNFSVGQRQLICLARAILRDNRILVLDEATANVDPITDVLIQRTIHEKFINYTMLTVAHRLHTVMGSDRIMVMDAGELAEFDEPYLLLKKPESKLSEMVLATGTEAAGLKQIAKNSYYDRRTQKLP